MSEEKKENLYPEDCTHDCSTCGSACEIDPDAGPSFFDRLESASEHFEAMGEENFINMLNEAVAELEAQDAAEEAAKGNAPHTKEIEEAAEEVAEKEAEKELGGDVEEVMEEEHRESSS